MNANEWKTDGGPPTQAAVDFSDGDVESVKAKVLSKATADARLAMQEVEKTIDDQLTREDNKSVGPYIIELNPLIASSSSSNVSSFANLGSFARDSYPTPSSPTHKMVFPQAVPIATWAELEGVDFTVTVLHRDPVEAVARTVLPAETARKPALDIEVDMGVDMGLYEASD